MDDTANEGALAENTADNAKMTETTDKAINENEARNNGDSSKKDSSFEEDLLGTNSLMMSDSDEDDDKITKAVRENGKIVDAKNAEANCEVIENGIHVNVETFNEDEKEIITKNKTNKKKISKIIDSDTDEDEDSASVAIESKELTKNSKNVQQNKKSKIAAMLDSDTDDDERSKNHLTSPAKSKSSRPKISALIDSDSEIDESKINSDENDKNSSSKYQVFDFDDESSDEKKSASTKHKSKKSKKSKEKTKLIDTDSEDETMHDQEHGTEVQEENENKNKKQPKEMRASAKKALDDIQAIQSEQQRLHREALISIPYHKPKRHTLQEFLKRRTIIKPTAAVGECSPAVASLRQKSLKMTTEELEEYAKLLDERAKEATEFFKSESESEEEELKPIVMDNENSPEMEINQIEKETVAENAAGINLDSETTTEFNDNNVEKEHLEPMELETIKSNEDEAAENDSQTPPAAETENMAAENCCSQPIVTEVLELPKLDLSTLHLNEEQPENISANSVFNASTGSHDEHLNEKCVERVLDVKSSLLSDLHLTDNPRLKGDSNMLIDLESGDLISKQPTGADNLLQRLLSTHKAKKHKVNETVNILSSENGRLEMTTVNFHHHDEENEFKKEQKPGAAFRKLKENLKTLIKKKRLEEIQKKQEDEDEYNKCLEGDDDDVDDEYEVEDESDLKVKQQKKKTNYDSIVIDEEENAFEEAEIADDDNEEEGEEADFDDDVDNEDMEGDNEEEIEEKNEKAEDKNVANIENFLADEASVDNDSDSSTDTDEDDNDEVEESNEPITFKEPFSKRKSRIIKAFDGDNDEDDDDDDDLLKTQIPVVATNMVTPLFGTLDSPIKQGLPHFDVAENVGGSTQELMDLCSGTFEATQPQMTNSMPTMISQIPLTMQISETDTTRELLALCSGSFEQTQKEQATQQHTPIENDCSDVNDENQAINENQPSAYKILSTDEEEALAKAGNTNNRIKKLRKKIKKRQAKLGFSDDEDEADMVGTKNVSDDDNDQQQNDYDMPETYIEYDSEENEIVVEMTKKDCIKAAGNFFEQEAELSESEWGSADEDEKHLDHYDIELGDEDDFDREKLQQELGQIHARKMLDEDIREVRKIQEMLFEDEENDGVGRQRQFRWKNAECGFSLNNMNRSHDDDGAYGAGFESGDEEQKQEHLWRKIRYEREQLLKEQGIMEDSQEALAQKLGIDSPLVSAENITKATKTTTPIVYSSGKKIQIITKKSTSSTTKATMQGKTRSPFLISATTKAATPKMSDSTSTKSTSNSTSTILSALLPLPNYTPPNTASILQPKAARGSFLMRDKDSLKKFANFTKGMNAASASANNLLHDDETAGTVSIKSMKAKNFVFATLSKEEHEHLKRKADDLINSSTENGTNFMKKPRTNQHNSATTSSMPRDKQCFIDKLLS